VLRGLSSIRILIAAVAVIALCFGSAILYFGASTAGVRHETEGMLSNGVPSSDRLSEARVALRDLDGRMDRAALDLVEKRPLNRTAIEAARKRLDDVIAAYRRLPYYPFERELNLSLDFELGRLDDVLKRLIALITAGMTQAAFDLENGEWRKASDRVDNRLGALLSLNMQQVTRHALRIDDIRRRSALVGMAVAAASMVLAFFATWVAVRAVRRQLRLQEERAAELEMFAARVAHDLKSPLATVALSLALTRDRVGDEWAVRATTGAISSLQRARQIVDDLLEFARSAGKPAGEGRTQVPEVVGSIVEELRPRAEEEGIDLSCEPFPSCEVACAPGVFSVLVTNLINNAIKFMGERTIRRITLRLCVETETARCEVADTGPGLPLGFHERAFEPYVRVSDAAPGLGLGLATVKRLAEAHRGRVGVRSVPGSGAVFWFELPRAGAPSPPPRWFRRRKGACDRAPTKGRWGIRRRSRR
jgi:signal transduction histidine kinase